MLVTPQKLTSSLVFQALQLSLTSTTELHPGEFILPASSSSKLQQLLLPLTQQISRPLSKPSRASNRYVGGALAHEIMYSHLISKHVLVMCEWKSWLYSCVFICFHVKAVEKMKMCPVLRVSKWRVVSG